MRPAETDVLTSSHCVHIFVLSGLGMNRISLSPSGAEATMLMGATHPLHIVLRLPVQPRGRRLCIAERRISFATRREQS